MKDFFLKIFFFVIVFFILMVFSLFAEFLCWESKTLTVFRIAQSGKLFYS